MSYKDSETWPTPGAIFVLSNAESSGSRLLRPGHLVVLRLVHALPHVLLLMPGLPPRRQPPSSGLLRNRDRDRHGHLPDPVQRRVQAPLPEVLL
eukprot:CAMPEP_0113674410 /NCGR_PEP_ID=MMETSP0038_2-20120614/7398_1 /TAXON_ID=2898 /ORGANISM="Cryptomonas paramecium" /LENGTH=93 /DNA_ID=CAMNT_0000590977 /DNA_START=166 /DNA_END=444 /DNA_ORIENTATION=+ /assembly_acc=CAM_ASM_000170